jgi:hypothetical protein
MWNIMLPWNRVLISSMKILQTSCELVLVAHAVRVWPGACGALLTVFSSDRSDLASPSEKKTN